VRTMNRFEKDFRPDKEARLKYLASGEFHILSAGTFVTCAVTKQKVQLENLRYWNAERQEAYVSAEAALTRELELAKDKQAKPRPGPLPGSSEFS